MRKRTCSGNTVKRIPSAVSLSRCSMTVASNYMRLHLLVHLAACCSALQHVAACCSVLQHVAARCSMLQRVAAFCSTLQHVAAWNSTLDAEWQGILDISRDICVCSMCVLTCVYITRMCVLWATCSGHISAYVAHLVCNSCRSCVSCMQTL